MSSCDLKTPLKMYPIKRNIDKCSIYMSESDNL